MRKRIRIIICLLCAVIILANMSSFYSQAADGRENTCRVLFLSSYSYAWDTVQTQIDGIMAGVSANCVLDFEFMDTKRLNDENAETMFYEGMAYRMEHVEPYDAVILGDDAALVFALEHREDMFDGIPLFFEGVNDEALARKAIEDPRIFGVMEKLSLEDNIELAKQFVPDLKKVVAILDNTLTGQIEREHFWAEQEKYPELTFSEINTSTLTEREIKRMCRTCSEDTVLLFITCLESEEGRLYSAHESLTLVTDVANVPVFRMVEAGLGDGIIGGSVTSMYQSGYMAATMAMDYLDGKEPSEKLVDAPKQVCIDEDVVRRYELSASAIPKDAVVINHQPGFFEKNAKGFKLASIPAVMLLCFAGFYLLEDQKKKSMMEKMECLNYELENASEHDFLTQLPNRSKFNKDIEELVEKKHPCSVFMLDIDDFKKINDTMGHSAGDEALCELARRLKELESESFRAYRLAGDEFITIFRHTEKSAVDVAAKKCSKVFEEAMVLHGEKHKITGSVGVAIYPKDAASAEQLMICADKAMYQVKKSGKNSYHFYDPSETEEN